MQHLFDLGYRSTRSDLAGLGAAIAALAAERAEATRRAVNLIRDPNGVIYDAALSVGDLSLALDIADYIERSLAAPGPQEDKEKPARVAPAG